MKRVLIDVSAVALVASSIALFAGCAVSLDRSEKENVSGESVGALSSYKDLGEIPGTGEARTAKYTGSPRYSAYTFYADRGDAIDVWVKGAKGSDDDAVAWVLDAKDATIGHDDDATPSTRDAHIETMATSAAAKSKYRIVFRDYWLDRATFTVTVVVTPAPVKCTGDEPNFKYVGHSLDQCKLVKFACEPGTTMFANACGCGCEQPSDCPSSINCMPGPGDASKKCAELRAKCPYTPVAF